MKHPPNFSITFFKVRIGEPATIDDVEHTPGKWFNGGRAKIREAMAAADAEQADRILHMALRHNKDDEREEEFEIVWEIVEYGEDY